MKQRLVVFGCSYTFGVGFPDCTPGDLSSPFYANPDRNTKMKHSEFTYPNYIAKDFNLELINKALLSSFGSAWPLNGLSDSGASTCNSSLRYSQ